MSEAEEVCKCEHPTDFHLIKWMEEFEEGDLCVHYVYCCVCDDECEMGKAGAIGVDWSRVCDECGLTLTLKDLLRVEVVEFPWFTTSPDSETVKCRCGAVAVCHTRAISLCLECSIEAGNDLLKMAKRYSEYNQPLPIGPPLGPKRECISCKASGNDGVEATGLWSGWWRYRRTESRSRPGP